MLDWLRNRGKSESEKREEAAAAYLDGALSPREKARFDVELRQDPTLQAELEAQREIKLLLSSMPRVRAPRNFTLDPAVYGRPEPALAARLYPRLRAATLVASLLFALSLTLNLWSGGPARDLAATPAPESVAAAPAAPIEEPAAEQALDEATVETFAAPQAEMAVMEEEAVTESVVIEEAQEAPLAPEVMAEGVAAADAEPAAGALAQTDSQGAPTGGEDGGAETLSPRPSPTAMTARAVEPTPTQAAAATLTADEQPPSAEIGALPAETNATATEKAAAAEPAVAAQPPFSPLVLGQVLLGFLALLLLIATFIIRQSSR